LAGRYLYVITNAELSKYNPATGALIWRVTPDPSFSLQYDSLAISGNLVIVGAETTGCVDPASLGEVFAFNSSTGALVWQTPLAFGGDSVIAQSFVVSTINAENNDTSVFDLSTGKFLWDTGGGCTQSANLVVAALVMTYGCDAQGNALEARTLATGAVVWTQPGSWTLQRGDLSGTAGQHLYATNSSGTVVDLNPLTGQTEYSLSGAVNVLAVDAARVYATCGTQGSELCGYSIATGALDWQVVQASTIAAVADSVLYLDSGQALNAATGQLISTVWASPNGSRASAIAIGDGRIAVVSDPRVLDLFGLPGY
jgi:outer membrane protein assembly factor BamB